MNYFNLKKLLNILNKFKDLVLEHSTFFVVLIIVLSVFFRVVFINADPPTDLSFSAALYTDEGFKVFESRNKALFGDWRWTSDDNYGGWKNQSPLPVLIYSHVFQFLGVNFFSIRILSIIYSLLTLVLFYFFMKSNFGKKNAIIGLLLFGINYYLVMFNRLGFYENHLNFYIMLSLYSFTETVKYSRRYLTSEMVSNVPHFIKHSVLGFILLLISISSFIAAYLTKQSALIIIVALLPAFLIVFIKKKTGSNRLSKYAFVCILFLLGVVYFSLAHTNSFNILLSSLSEIFGENIFSKIPVKQFDPIYLVLGKSLFLEVIFLQPVLFFIGLFYAIYVFYEYLWKSEKKRIEIYMASWVFFGFILLTLLTYHPARYYLLLSIPLVILVSRALLSVRWRDVTEFLTIKAGFPFNYIINVFRIMASVYAFVFICNQVIPFNLKHSFLHLLYSAHDAGDYSNALPYIAIILCLLFLTILAIYFSRKQIKGFILRPGINYLVLVLIIFIQSWQYGKWFLFHEYKLFNSSREIGEIISPDAVIAGSWSAGLTIENKNRALILMKNEEYNNSLLMKLLKNEEVPVKTGKGKKEQIKKQNNIPVYLAVSPNTVFEKKIMARYNNFISPDNLLRKYNFGYFDVDIYALNRSRTLKNLKKDI